jgi:hypothetical protein
MARKRAAILDLAYKNPKDVERRLDGLRKGRAAGDLSCGCRLS